MTRAWLPIHLALRGASLRAAFPRFGILLLAPLLGCRGEFDISQYLAGDDTGATDTNTDNSSSESGMSGSESAGTDTDSTESSETDSTDTDTTETDTAPNCADDELELGGGCFGVREIIETDIEPTDLTLADFSGDNRVDLLLAGAEFRLRLRTDSNTFDGAMALSGVTGNGVAVGDVDVDGLLDIAAIGESIGLHTAIGGGGFTENAILPLAGFDGVFANFDGDNDVDLLVTGTTLRIATNEAGSWVLNTELGYPGERVRVTDFEKDGDIDIVLAHPANNQVALFANAGNGSIGSPTLFVLPEVEDLEFSELDDDDAPELLVVGTDTVTAYDVQPNLAVTELSTHAVGEDPQAIAVADLDGDGLLDAATVNLASDDVSILLRGNSGLAPELRLQPGSSTDNPTLIAAADLDNDGRAELVVVAPGTNRLFVLGVMP